MTRPNSKIVGIPFNIMISKNKRYKYAVYECICGNRFILKVSHSTSYRSCGCIHKSRKHSACDTTEYRIWRGILTRCNNRNSKQYNRYGGRGITVCREWHDFRNFLEDMGLRPDNKSIDRIDNNGSYSKNNCRWATSKEQNRNMCNNRLLEINGIIATISEWSESDGAAPESTIRGRIDLGWTDNFKIVFCKVDGSKRKKV